MKKICLILAMVLMPTMLLAQNISWGLEWGSDIQAFSWRHVNYISSEGYRINDTAAGMDIFPNLEVLAHVGMRTGTKWEFGLYSGYCGLYSGARAIPIFIRAAFHPKAVLEDGLWYYWDSGVSFLTPTLMSRLGAGYRFMIGGSSALDILLGLRCNVEQPPVIDRDTNRPVPADKIRRSQAAHLGFSITVALSF